MLPSPDGSRVVLIGASRFTDSQLSDLPAVRDNVVGLAKCLEDPGLWGLPAKHCVKVLDPSSADALVDPIHEAAAQATDTLIVYYAGHGLLDENTNELLLALTHTRFGRTHTAVPYEYVRRDVSHTRATRRVVILDCCYSGRVLGTMSAATATAADQASIAGAYVLASAPPNRQALSLPGQRYSAFTGELIALLAKGLVGAGEFLTLDVIYSHIHEVARSNSLPEPQKRGGNTAGNLALVRNRSWQPGTGQPTPGSPEPTGRKPLLSRRRLVVGLTGTAALTAGAITLVPRIVNGSSASDGGGSNDRFSTAPYRVLTGHSAPVWNVGFTADGKLLASCGGDATIRLWDVASGAQVGGLYGHVGAVWGCPSTVPMQSWQAQAPTGRSDYGTCPPGNRSLA